MKILLLALGFLAAAPALAADAIWLTATVRSYHFDRGSQNEANYGLGVEYATSPRWTFAVGEYRNSRNHTTFYGFANWTPLQVGAVKLGAGVGGVTGYANSVSPVAHLLAAVEGKAVGANLVFFPPYGRNTTGVLGLQLKWRFQ